ncbi:hypothetical protein F5X68DRAFT_683 [Plectosphaerella plurivora]|uniref:Uncharacterized protein n=1 Tax=Plectosphaerella plurivora TaxID=936078 RepID=A0A9P8VL89_9PEZI|nr:hypothetical protein F5X68DRAFT_683 [Plectosphaerella plurivora]
MSKLGSTYRWGCFGIGLLLGRRDGPGETLGQLYRWYPILACVPISAGSHSHSKNPISPWENQLVRSSSVWSREHSASRRPPEITPTGDVATHQGLEVSGGTTSPVGRKGLSQGHISRLAWGSRPTSARGCGEHATLCGRALRSRNLPLSTAIEAASLRCPRRNGAERGHTASPSPLLAFPDSITPANGQIWCSIRVALRPACLAATR